MGGDDWRRWSAALHAAGLLAPGGRNLAYTYAGPTYTHAIYRGGTIGRAKQHLERTALELDRELPARSLVSVNKALVTQASAAIPVIPLYLMLLFRVMKERGSHEGAIQQIHRLFAARLYTGEEIPTDHDGRVRIDDWEMDAEVQREVERRFAAFAEWRRRRPGGGTGRPGRLPRRLPAPVRLRPVRYRLRRRRRPGGSRSPLSRPPPVSCQQETRPAPHRRCGHGGRFKRDLSLPDRFLRTVVALANTTGGG